MEGPAIVGHDYEQKDFPLSIEERIKKVLETLDTGVLSLVEYLDQHGQGDAFLDDLDHCSKFINQMRDWCGRMPVTRMEEATLTLIKNLFAVTFQSLEIDPAEFQKPQSEQFPGSFLIEASCLLGPELIISNDKMSASIRIPHINLLLWNPTRLETVLKNIGIQNGIDLEAIESVFLPEKIDQLVRIARGKVPIPGNDAVITNLLGLERRKPITNNDINIVDYKEVHDFKPVKEGQIIYKKTPLTQGEPGFDVYGEPIPSIPGLDEKLPTIKNCTLSEDGLSIISTVDGCAYFKDDELVVVPALMISGNLDYNVGNVRTEVAVTVKKNILSDFHIHSQSDIAVEGVIEGADLKAKGTIFCKGGVNGKSKANLQAGKDCQAKYLNEAKVIAGQLINVSGSIIHSQVQARRVNCLGKDAEIIGGKIIAWDDICADVIGSEAGVTTELILGAEHEALKRKVELMHHQAKQKNDEIEKLQHYQLKLNPEDRKISACTPDTQKKLKKVKLLMDQANQQLDQIKIKLNQAENDLSISEKGIRMVRAKKTIHSGTIIRVLDQTMKITTPTGPASIVFSEGKLLKQEYIEREDLDEHE